jgi:hypothetical protein
MNDSVRSHWYQVPLMWLVVGIPALTVVAGFATLWLATAYPDPVVAAAGAQGPTVASGAEPAAR